MFFGTAPSLLDYSIQEWRHERAFHIEDAYKWLFHATLGGEHAVPSIDGARSWMDAEWKTLGQPVKGEPMTVQLRPDGRLLRVNLRPYKAHDGSEEKILAIFVQSAKGFHADRAIFRRVWKQLGSRLRAHPIGNLNEVNWKRLDLKTSPTYPAIDHSAAYETANHPAYRVVEASKWMELRPKAFRGRG